MMKVVFFILLAGLSSLSQAFDHKHSLYGEVLSNSVVRTGPQTLVNYQKLSKDPAKLNQYITELSQVSEKEFASWSKAEQLALLINGYNAWTLQLIVRNYPVTSIKKIGSLFSSAWKQDFIHWQGKKVNLDHIEHDLIRKKYAEPRIHFALVCAAMSCPSLQERPFEANDLEAQLTKATKEFLGDRKKNSSVIEGQTLVLKLSSIFEWYGSDFGSKDELSSFFVSQMGLTQAAKEKKISFDFQSYNWDLNVTK